MQAAAHFTFVPISLVCLPLHFTVMPGSPAVGRTQLQIAAEALQVLAAVTHATYVAVPSTRAAHATAFGFAQRPC